jgi:hypothetical protein
MPRKSYKPEEIVAKLRQVDVLTSQGQSVAEAIRSSLRVRLPGRVAGSKIRVHQWFAANQILVIASRTGNPRLAKSLRRFWCQAANGERVKALAVERR